MTIAMATVAMDFRRQLLVGQEAKRAATRERLAAVLGTAILLMMVGYMLVGDRPFRPDLAAASEISPINRWVWLGLFGLALPVLWLRRGDLVRLAPAIWPLLALYGWYIVTTAWALDQGASSRRVAQSVVTLVCCVAVVLGVRRAERIHLLLCIPCMLVVSVDLASWFVVPGLAMTKLGLQGLHAQKNMLGMYSMVTVLAGVTCALNLTGVRRLAILCGCGIALITLLASRSGTSIGLTFAALVTLPALVVVVRRHGLVVAAALLGPALLVAGGIALYLMWCGLAAVDPWAPLSGVTFTKRTDLWAFLVENIAKRPWGGAGFGSFWAIDKTVQPSILSGLWFGRGPDTVAPEGHNAYLDLAATTGLIGLALGLLVLVRAIMRGGAAVRAAPGGMALATAAFQLGYCLMVAGHSFMESTLFAPNSQLGTLFILAAVTLEWARLPAGAVAVRAPRVLPRRGSGAPAMPAAPAHR